MLCRQRRGWSGALSSVWGSASNLSTQSGRVPPNGDSVVPRRGTGPHHIVVFVIGHRGPNAVMATPRTRRHGGGTASTSELRLLVYVHLEPIVVAAQDAKL